MANELYINKEGSNVIPLPETTDAHVSELQRRAENSLQSVHFMSERIAKTIEELEATINSLVRHNKLLSNENRMLHNEIQKLRANQVSEEST